jgi:hypothetical protein
MNEQLTDTQIRAAFVARASGRPSPDLQDRIHAAATTTRQERPLIALPGLGRLAPVRHLALAAALGATILVVAGSLFFGVGTQPSTGPNVPPAAPPSGTPSAPPSLTPGFIFTPDSVVKVSAVGNLDIFALATADSDKLGEVQPSTSVYIVAGPTTVDGDDWYQVKPYAASLAAYPFGWVRVAHDDGRPALEPAALECATGNPVTPANVLDMTPTGALACFGNEDITIVGRVFCMPNDDLPENLQHRVTGPFWLDDGRYCAFQDESGEPYFELFGFPTDELPPTWRTDDLAVSGHFDDPESVDCTGLDGLPSLSPDEAVFECRLGFHVTGVAVAD